MRAIPIAVVTFLTLVALFLFASGMLRSFVGDIVVIVFCASVLAALGIGSPRSRGPGMALVGCGLEGFQALSLVGPDSHWLAHAILGSTPDPLDVVAYALGAVVTLLLEPMDGSRKGRPTPPPPGP